MFVLDANFTNSERETWMVGFVQVTAQDWIITPLLFVFIHLQSMNDNLMAIVVSVNKGISIYIDI